MGRVEDVARKKITEHKVLVGNPEGKSHYKVMAEDWRTLLKRNFAKRVQSCGLDSFDSECEPELGSYEHSTETSVCIIC
jgi:hypothetical protein